RFTCGTAWCILDQNKTIRYGFVISEVGVLLFTSPGGARAASIAADGGTAPFATFRGRPVYLQGVGRAFFRDDPAPFAGRDRLKDGDCKHACPEMLETIACSRPGGDHPPCPGLCCRVVDRRASLAPQ